MNSQFNTYTDLFFEEGDEVYYVYKEGVYIIESTDVFYSWIRERCLPENLPRRMLVASHNLRPVDSFEYWVRETRAKEGV